MLRVCAAQAVRKISGAEHRLYSSRKWCSVAHTESKPSESASRTCSMQLRTVRASLPPSGCGCWIGYIKPKRIGRLPGTDSLRGDANDAPEAGQDIGRYLLVGPSGNASSLDAWVVGGRFMAVAGHHRVEPLTGGVCPVALGAPIRWLGVRS